MSEELSELTHERVSKATPEELMNMALIQKGFAPHSKGNEVWWEKPDANVWGGWPGTIAFIALLVFVLIVLRGWPL